jgi:hypothetical protein
VGTVGTMLLATSPPRHCLLLLASSLPLSPPPRRMHVRPRRIAPLYNTRGLTHWAVDGNNHSSLSTRYIVSNNRH